MLRNFGYLAFFFSRSPFRLDAGLYILLDVQKKIGARKRRGAILTGERING